MNPKQAIDRLHWSKPIHCEAHEWPTIREAVILKIHEWRREPNEADELRAFIACQEIGRLDALHAAPPAVEPAP